MKSNGLTFTVIIITIFLSFTIGFLIAGFVFQTITLSTHLDLLNIIISILVIASSIAGLLRLFLEYFKNKREKEKIPVLELGQLIHTYSIGKGDFGEYSLTGYYLNLKKVSGEGSINGCQAHIDVDGIDTIYRVWKSNDLDKVNISIKDSLALFSVSEHKETSLNIPKTIGFYTYSSNSMRLIEKKYDDFLDRTLNIVFGSDYGIVRPNTYSKTIREIIKDAIA
jgi:uncharacterized membrane protein